MTYDVNNKQQEMAYQLIKDTNVSFFLTGKAGTGKTTFLKKIQEEINKNFIVLAPTGIAAINAGGDTIHSFFGFPFSVITFKEVGKVRNAKSGIADKANSSLWYWKRKFRFRQLILLSLTRYQCAEQTS